MDLGEFVLEIWPAAGCMCVNAVWSSLRMELVEDRARTPEMIITMHIENTLDMFCV